MRSEGRHLTLVVPGLLDKTSASYMLAEEEGARGSADVEALEWLLTLAECRPQSPSDPLALLWRRAGQAGSVPVAALSYRYDLGELSSGPVLRADPVCLTADRDCVRMVNAELLDLSVAHARQLIAEINAQFSAESWRLVLGAAQRWYLLLDDDAAITTQAPGLALGDDIHDFMPRGQRQGYWRSIVNEIEMLMFSSPVNQQRQAQGMAPVTSLWLWGEGEAPSSLSLPWDEVYVSDPVIAGLGLMAGLSVSPALTAAALFDLAPTAGRILCWPPLTAGSQGRVRFNHDWALPLYKALQRGLFSAPPEQPLALVELLTANEYSYVLAAGQRRWWRHRRIDRFLG